jgi:hypothetical protein
MLTRLFALKLSALSFRKKLKKPEQAPFPERVPVLFFLTTDTQFLNQRTVFCNVFALEVFK